MECWVYEQNLIVHFEFQALLLFSDNTNVNEFKSQMLPGKLSWVLSFYVTFFNRVYEVCLILQNREAALKIS